MADQSGGFKSLLISSALFVLFAFLILTSTSLIANSYSKDTSEVLNGSLEIDSYSSYLDDISATGQEKGAEFEQDQPFGSTVDIVLAGIWNIALGFVVFVTTPFTLLAGVIALIVMNQALANTITGVLFSLLVITIIYSIYRVIRIGD